MKKMMTLGVFAFLALASLLVACGDDSTNSDCEAGCSKYFECEDEVASAAGVTVEVLRAYGFSNKGDCVSQCEAEINSTDGEDAADGEDAGSNEACQSCLNYSDCADLAECIVANCD